MRILARIAQIAFVICLPFLFFSASIAGAVNSQWLYTAGFDNQNVRATTGLSDAELARVAGGLVRYWNSGEQIISLTASKNGQNFELFNEREKEHLKDVKALFRLDYRVMLITGAYALGYILWRLSRRKQEGLRGLVWSVGLGSALTLTFMLALGLGALLGADRFANFWWQFHVLSFANDLWQLDPSQDYLLMLVPQGFWYDAVRDIVFATAGIALVLGGAAIAHLVFNKGK